MLRAYGGSASGGKVRRSGRGAGNGSSFYQSSETLVTWDPAQKGSSVTLSNNNRTAVTSTNQGDWVLATTTKTTGKWYFEVVWDDLAGNFSYVGIAKPSTIVVENGAANGTFMMQRDGGIWSTGGGTNGTGYTAGDVAGFTVDLSTKIVRAYKNNVANGISPVGTWTVGDPVTIAFLVTFDPPAGVTLRTTSALFSYEPPSGFLPWGAA